MWKHQEVQRSQSMAKDASTWIITDQRPLPSWTGACNLLPLGHFGFTSPLCVGFGGEEDGLRPDIFIALVKSTRWQAQDLANGRVLTPVLVCHFCFLSSEVSFPPARQSQISQMAPVSTSFPDVLSISRKPTIRAHTSHRTELPLFGTLLTSHWSITHLGQLQKIFLRSAYRKYQNIIALAFYKVHEVVENLEWWLHIHHTNWDLCKRFTSLWFCELGTCSDQAHWNHQS